MNGTGPDNFEKDLFKQRLLDVSNNHDTSTPLFLYYAPHIVHTPFQVPDSYLNEFSFIDDKDSKIYHAMVNYLDDVVGELVDALKKKGMWDNTLLLVVIMVVQSILEEGPVTCLLYTSPSPRDATLSRMPSSA